LNSSPKAALLCGQDRRSVLPSMVSMKLAQLFNEWRVPRDSNPLPLA